MNMMVCYIIIFLHIFLPLINFLKLLKLIKKDYFRFNLALIKVNPPKKQLLVFLIDISKNKKTLESHCRINCSRRANNRNSDF